MDSSAKKIMSLCSGVGGIELGLKLVIPNARVVMYCEREAYDCEILVRRMEEKLLDEAPIWSDIKTFDGTAWSGKVDIITAGFPCQPFSAAGKREGTEDERWIWPDIARIIGEVRPRYVFLENVPGLVSGGGLLEVLGDLAEIGYDAEWMHLSAAAVGAPHKRERVWVLAYANTGREPQQEGGIPYVREWIDNGSEDVAYSKGERGFSAKQQGQRDGIEQGGEVLADTFGNGLGGILWEARQGEEGPQQRANPDGEGIGDGRTRAPCAEIPNAKRSGCQRGNEKDNIREKTTNSIMSQNWWAVEPSMGRVVNGMAYRVDRIRACGNGVVSLVAAVAHRILKNRIGGI